MMYCPKCAAPHAEEQKFCRACGFDLQVVAQLFSTESEADELDQAGASEDLQNRKKRLESLGVITMMLALMIGCLIPISMGLFPNWAGLTPLILILSGLAGLPLFGGIILLVYADTLTDTPVHQEAARSPTLQRAVTTKRLPAVNQAEPVPSIAEHTTDLLNTPLSKDS